MVVPIIFQRSPYGREHKLVILAPRKPKIKDSSVLTFEEEFEHYKNMCTGKYAKWATKEGFMLEYNSLWKDLQKAYYVYCGNSEIEEIVKQNLNVIEVC